MPPCRKLAAVAPQPDRPAPDLRDSVEAAIGAMTWLTESDRALADVARKLAEQIELAQARADLQDRLFSEVSGDPGMFRRLQKLEAMCDVAKVIGWLGPQLQGVLRDLGGTPAARKAMQPGGKMGGRLADLRTAAAKAPRQPGVAARKRDAAAVDAAAEEADPPVNGRVRRNRVR